MSGGRKSTRLCFLTGQTVGVADAFRIGRFDANKIRPIIVKLRTAWDRRIILANCSKLKDFGNRICVSPDESPEGRLVGKNQIISEFLYELAYVWVWVMVIDW